jgi:hypothetical protein
VIGEAGAAVGGRVRGTAAVALATGIAVTLVAGTGYGWMSALDTPVSARTVAERHPGPLQRRGAAHDRLGPGAAGGAGLALDLDRGGRSESAAICAVSTIVVLPDGYPPTVAQLGLAATGVVLAAFTLWRAGVRWRI